jgi:high-affinity Fe2+/Pb2+ permease
MPHLLKKLFTQFLFQQPFSMISFLGLWLCTVTLASGGIFHQALAGGEHTALHFQVLGAHVVAFVAFAVYWMILYPRYFTPFGNIPTPSVRIHVTSHRDRQGQRQS